MITLHYFGSVASLESPQLADCSSRLDTVLVKQHCCGANVRTVFQGKVAPKSTFCTIQWAKKINTCSSLKLHAWTAVVVFRWLKCFFVFCVFVTYSNKYSVTLLIIFISAKETDARNLTVRYIKESVVNKLSTERATCTNDEWRDFGGQRTADVW